MTETTQASPSPLPSEQSLSAWQTFLQSQTRTPATSLPLDFVAPLDDAGLISLAGEDAASFLHKQITNDVEKLDLNQVRLAGYCTPKGRLLASFLLWKEADRIVLQLPRSLQPTIQKRLQMFVMRDKAKLADISDQRVALGLSGTAATVLLAQWFAVMPEQPYSKVDSDHGTLLRLADSRGVARYQWFTTTEQAIAAWPVLTQNLPALTTSAWRLSDIYAGVPTITTATQEKFVPQMINFELIGGVNFKKGCYPGQEIVARSQYLGKLKRRSVLALIEATEAAEATEATAATAVQAGNEVFSSEDPEQPCGMVVNAEAIGSGATTFACLVELKLAATENGSIHLGSVNGPALQLQSLPYELAEPQ